MSKYVLVCALLAACADETPLPGGDFPGLQPDKFHQVVAQPHAPGPAPIVVWCEGKLCVVMRGAMAR